jgi:hypothetical protein
MAFDQTTRNRLQRFVNDARRVLEEEFTRQLQNDYGMDPNAGSVAELASLRHINDAQRETARILRDTLAHYTASGDINATQGLDRIVREQAFTVLNRLAALRMAEARGLLVESVGNGFQAKGFQLYARLAGTGLGETGDVYRVYLFSVFDELAQDLPGLFDRYSPQGRLFPREAALLQVVNLINDGDIAPLWIEDETIGWIYQYFNSKEERKAMRDASQAPRNSRELAVRNQFFTPRYVVEFLVDNTLGRLWFNATGGVTNLRERCQYLLVKPDETPQAATRLRDPRTLKLLDPACGSMHFGLYAFDLFAEIYREASAWEKEHGPGSLDVSTQPQAALKPLSQTYEDEAAFLRDVPRLIIEHNIYGVDIDPRAAQIASLALWLRAQRAWHDAGVKAKNRPPIGRGHVVAAIAPPAERELRQQFAVNVDQRDAELFEKTLQLLKGLPELGVLLQVERELPNLIRQVYVGKGTGLFAAQEQANWQQAEARLRDALNEFAQAAKSTYQRRLFAQDALQGLRLIDLCREKFDVIVMNPPFGEVTPMAATYTERTYPEYNGNLLCAFILRALQLMRAGGRAGAIFDRTAIVKTTYEDFRRQALLEKGCLAGLLDLGWGVLDANVEVTAAIIDLMDISERVAPFIDVRSEAVDQKSDMVLRSVKSYRGGSASDYRVRTPSDFLRFPNSVIGYDFPEFVIEAFAKNKSLAESGVRVIAGHSITSFRYFRFWWEVPAENSFEATSDWQRFYNGGEYSRYCSHLSEAVFYGKQGAALVADDSTIFRNLSFQQVGGVGFGKRGEYIDAHLLPPGFVSSVEGQAVIVSEGIDRFSVLALFNSRLFQFIINLYCGQHKYPGYVGIFPAPNWSSREMLAAGKLAAEIWAIKSYFERSDESNPEFCGLHSVDFAHPSFIETFRVARTRMLDIEREIERLIHTAYGLTEAESDLVFSATSGQPDDGGVLWSAERSFWAENLAHYVLGRAIGRWDRDEGVGPEKNFSEVIRRLQNSSDGHLVWAAPTTRGLPIFSLERSIGTSLLEAVRREFEFLFGNDSAMIEESFCGALSVGSLEDFYCDPRRFFGAHIRKYSRGRRAAPIYWPISTRGGGFTLWIYFPSLTNQVLYRAVNDFIGPRLKQVDTELSALRAKGIARTRSDERALEALQTFESELRELRDGLLNIAPEYNPGLNDGVQISAAPLYEYMGDKTWQRSLQETWTNLKQGDYDWAHLAMNYWPDRVREKCRTDRSLAIAHGLEDLYIEPEAKPKKGTRQEEGRG